jgi:predicted transcriptional regulator YdeE
MVVKSTYAAFDVIGISARTTNKAEFDGKGVIASLWQRFFAEQVYAKVPHRTDSKIMALYCEYASDKDDAYTIVLGVRVTHVDKIPAGMVVQHVPAQPYAIFTTQKGQMPGIVVNTWQEIWRQEQATTLKRAYCTDYELYDERSSDPQNAQIDIYIGIKA